MTSRARGAAEGLRLAGEGGVVSQQLTVPAETGTTVEVHDLFFNTPARLKFLKTPTTELSASLRIVGQLALAHPATQLRVTNNGRAVADGAGGEPTCASASAPCGAGRPPNGCWRWTAREHGVRIAGWASPPDVTRGSREDIVVIINGRPVRDPALLQAVLAAYRPLLPRDRFPLVVLAVALAPADVDANVHPTKAWVRFRQPGVVQEMLVSALHEALRRPAVVPTFGATAGASVRRAPASSASRRSPSRRALPGAARAVRASRFGRVLGQVQDTFIVSTTDDEVFFLDQHVVHERVVFEQVRGQLAAGHRCPRRHCSSRRRSISAAAARALLERWREPLERLGFGFEGFGGDSRGPARGAHAAQGRRAQAPDRGRRGGARRPQGGRAHARPRAGLRGVPGGDEGEHPAGARGDGASGHRPRPTETPYFCPHGRPIVSRVSMQDIRRELKRTW